MVMNKYNNELTGVVDAHIGNASVPTSCPDLKDCQIGEASVAGMSDMTTRWHKHSKPIS
jgi:hypothetical protein